MNQLPVEVEEDLLSTKQRNMLDGLSEELRNTYAKRQIFRTDTEARISVLDDVHFPTKAAKYWQAVREQAVMLEQLAILSFDFRRNEVAIKRHSKRMQETTDELDLEDASIDLAECTFKRASMQTVADDRVREIAMWSAIKRELDDGSFDTEDVDVHQLVSYTVRFLLRTAEADLSQMTSGERDNLAGQVSAALKRCEQQGVLDRVKTELPARTVAKLGLK